MAFTYGFYNSLNGDRKYDARHISAIFDGIINDGVYASIPNLYAVRPGAGMQVLVGSGRAWFNRTWNDNDADFPINIPAADPLLYRYYAICLEVNTDEAVRANRLMSIQGTLGSQAAVTKPVLTKSETINQWALAYVLVPPGVIQITTSMIEVVVGMAETPFVTGIIETASIDALFQQWDGDFNAWWDNIKATLDENIVTNLQNQIDARVKIADLATEDEAIAGIVNNKWMSPGRVKRAVDTGVADAIQYTNDGLSDLSTRIAIRQTSWIGNDAGSGSRYLEPGGKPLGLIVTGMSNLFLIFKSDANERTPKLLLWPSSSPSSLNASFTWTDSRVTWTWSGGAIHGMNSSGIYTAYQIFEPDPPVFTTVTVLDDWGSPLPNVTVENLWTIGLSRWVSTNAAGIAQGIVGISKSIKLTGLLDKIDTTYDVSASIGQSVTKVYPTRAQNEVMRLTTSQDLYFSSNVEAIDRCLVGGGANGSSGGPGQTGSGSGGGGGAMINAFNQQVIPFEKYPLIVAGGNGDTSFMGDIAVRGTIPTAGSPGMGNGGVGGVSGQPGQAATAVPFNDIAYPERFGGGGGGAFYSSSGTAGTMRRAGGSPNGGAGGDASGNPLGATAGIAGGIGGGGGAGGATGGSSLPYYQPGGAGGPGIALIRLRLKQVT